MKKPLNPATDHAVIRWLELRTDVDVDAIRQEIGRNVEVGLDHGAGGVRADGLLFLIRSGVVVDICPASLPPRHIGSYKRRPEIDDG